MIGIIGALVVLGFAVRVVAGNGRFRVWIMRSKRK